MASALETDAMRHAILLSAFGLGTTSPNPPVGCVVLDPTGRRIGEGYHERKGEAHAETRALAGAGSAAAGATAVVTLEPCNHHGLTPPCRKALVDAGIARVVIAVLDPTSRGDGGAAELRKAGLSVEVGVCEDEARLVLGPWLAAPRSGRPTVTWAYQPDRHPDSAIAFQVGRQEQPAIEELRAGWDVVLFGDGRITEGTPGGHGIGVFALPSGPLPADPGETLASLTGAGARTVLLVGDRRIAGPFLAVGLIDQVILQLTGSIDVPVRIHDTEGTSSGLPAGFKITHIARTPDGIRVTAAASSDDGPRPAERSTGSSLGPARLQNAHGRAASQHGQSSGVERHGAEPDDVAR